jgi:nicotinamide-nucleotide amidase
MPEPLAGRPPAEDLVALLGAAGQSLAVAESLTGGQLAARVVDVPGASAVLRGAVVAYATDLKHRLLGVDADLLRRHGPVHPDVASAMARGVRDRLGADWGVATTGVAGPDPQDGVPPGRVFVAVSGPGAERCERLDLPGGRADVRAGAVTAALALLLRELAGSEHRSPRGS